MMEVFEQLPGENAKHYAKRALLYNLVNLEMKPGDKITESDLCELKQNTHTRSHSGTASAEYD